MSTNLTSIQLANVMAQINSATTISHVTKIARLIGGYRFHRTTAPAFTTAELAWFRAPIGGL